MLRRPPLGPVAPGAHDMAREWSVLSVLYQQFPLAPRALVFSDDPAIIGAPFFVMERRTGVVVRRTLPPEFDTATAPAAMSAALVDALADFHAVDVAALGLENLGKPAGFLERQVAGWARRWHAAKTVEVAAMDEVEHWLAAHVPSSSAATLVHCDYKLDNVMLAADDPGRLVAVFDWDMCTLGDPLSDLGTLLAYWSEPTDPPHFQAMSMMPTDGRFLTRDQLVARYAARSGRDVTAINFYHALGLYRLAVIVAQIYVRFARGQTQDQRFSRFGDLIPLVAQAAQDVALAGAGRSATS